ncbi:MAG TPA: sarcosine oxidase subunit delta [Acetobacteraceae bacterium]|jgi:heterotetrameric sarcosine oxidase delta subunit|nr:sarcosine oxidase subunit delta [Acetobacteraceae bacterium]
MLIPCPHCGERPHSEFIYGGDATLYRPADPTRVSDMEWYDYVYLRTNPRGPHNEFWHHTLGCDQWIEVTRDTLTHRILAAAAIGSSAAGDTP